MPGLLDPRPPHPTKRSSSSPPSASGENRVATSGQPRPLDVLDRSFRLLVCEPTPLALDGHLVGHGLPARPIPLDVLRSLLLHPSVGFDTRDAALTWLVGRAQTEGGTWLVGLAGVLLPGIGRRVYPLCRAFQVILARSGAGKSYLAKLEALRWLYQGVQVLVVDPESKYQRLAEAVGGACLRLGAPGVHLNPFDLGSEPDALTRRALFAHTLLAVLLGGPLDSTESAVVDRAVLAAYTAPGDHQRPTHPPSPCPLLIDLAHALQDDPDPAGPTLATRLGPYVTGSYRGLFAQSTSTRPDGHLLVLSLRDLPEELKAVGTLLALDTLWRQVTDRGQRRRLVVVDEAWLLAQQPAGARFLARLAKSARKYWCALTVVTQDAGDLLASELGQAVVANAATHLLLGQAPQAIPRLTAAFGLTQGERRLLLAARVGEGLLAGPGGQRAAFTALASPAEHALCTSDPAELASQQRPPEPAW